MKEFKKRFVSFLWTFPYLFLALLADFLMENIGLIQLTELQILLLTAGLREVGKFARNKVKK